MDRREFLKTTGGAAAAAAAAGTATASAADEVSAPAIKSGAKALRLSMRWPDDGKGFGDSARRLARRIEAASEGHFRIELVESSKTGIDAIAAKDADLYHGTEHDHASLHPAFAFFAGLPWSGSLPENDLKSWLIAAGGAALWDDLAADFGVKAFVAGHTGPTFLWSKVPLDNITTITGQKILAMGLGAGVVHGIGAEPAELAPGEIKTALQSNTVVAAEYGGVIAAMSMGLPEVAPRVTATPLNGAGTAMSLGIAKALWDELGETEKGALAHAASEEFATTIAEERAHRAPIMSALHDRFGVKEHVLADDIRGAMDRVGGVVVAHAAGHDEKAARINASYMGFANQAHPRVA